MAAKNSIPDSKSGPDHIDKQEFRLFLVALTQRLEYLQAFNKLDAGGNGSIDIAEFMTAKDLVEKWVGPIDVDAEFTKMDSSGSG
jgi:Ca2+-binding EF-hand superfamily protein